MPSKRSWYISKRFTEYRRGLEVVRLDTKSGKDRVDFHSFRRSAIQVLERARLPQTEVAQVVGHDREGITFGTYNPEGLEIRDLLEVVEAIRYAGIDYPIKDASKAWPQLRQLLPFSKTPTTVASQKSGR